MTKPFLLSRVLLHFNSKSSDLLGEISAATLTPDGSLWVGSDELNTLERLSRLEPHVFGDHQSFAIADFIEMFNHEGEVDIEGMDYTSPYLWFTGSHSTKRKKTKGKKPEKDIKRLTKVETELNRYLLARIPVVNGEPFKSCTYPEHSTDRLTAACLQKTDASNILIDALKEDEHLGIYLSNLLPSKENGFDIEGLAVHGNRIFLGLRGPVLRGWAIILELEVEESEPGTLILKAVGDDGLLYRKHFVDLNGMGVRELCLQGGDLLILAGPTMDLEGAMRVFRMKDPLDRSENSICSQENGDLEVAFDLPFTFGSDHAEGLTLYPCLNESEGLLVVYDDPDPVRKVGKDGLFVDVFRLS